MRRRGRGYTVFLEGRWMFEFRVVERGVVWHGMAWRLGGMIHHV